MKISLRAGERIYINGAVLRVDRKVTLELLNDVTFLLENHILQPEAANTPLRQLYFVIQTMLMEPEGRETKLQLFQDFYEAMYNTFDNASIRNELPEVDRLVKGGRHFEALRRVRKLFPEEAEILANTNLTTASLRRAPRSRKDGSYAA